MCVDKCGGRVNVVFRPPQGGGEGVNDHCAAARRAILEMSRARNSVCHSCK